MKLVVFLSIVVAIGAAGVAAVNFYRHFNKPKPVVIDYKSMPLRGYCNWARPPGQPVVER